jgi:hypothetical protein
LGHNFIGSRSGCSFTKAGGDITGRIDFPLDPKLGPLQDNGGPTWTHALLEGSAAIDAGDDSAAPTTDQRGLSRVGTSDIGAFELQQGPVSVPSAQTLSLVLIALLFGVLVVLYGRRRRAEATG